MRECRSKSSLARCNCSWEPCSRKGVCCECLAYHWRQGELPAGLFPDWAERTFDRSLRTVIEIYRDKGR
jgi:hypothetical protein